MRPRVLQAVTFTALVLAGLGAWTLWAEYLALRGEWDRDARSRVIGYPGVQPHFSLALPPPDWLHDDGDSTVLWAGWDRRAKKHDWFTVGRGQIVRDRLSAPMGIDAVRAIDKPRVEARGGEIWGAIPPENLVACCNFLGESLAYPLGVLDKVLIVNDEVHTKPILIVFTPFVDAASAVDLFNPTVDGKRLTMGHSGYLWDRRPLLYDREGRSLWVPSGEGLTAVAGPLRGTVLPRIVHLDPVPWGKWSAEHPKGRLLAGAIRPELQNLKP